jgi:DNA-binding XRE family transcriptional regulator
MPTPKTPRKRNKNGKLVQRRRAVQNEGLGKVLYAIREKLQLSQYEMADRVGISRFNMSRLEKGPIGTSLWDKRWQRIAQVFPEVGAYLTKHGLGKESPVTQRERDAKEKGAKCPSFDVAFSEGYKLGKEHAAAGLTTPGEVERLLEGLDVLALDIQRVPSSENYWSRRAIYMVDEIADELEIAAYGKDSFERRRDETLLDASRARPRTTWTRPNPAPKADLLKKADLAVSTAKSMLGRTATDQAVEDQAVDLMALPDMCLVDTYQRLSIADEG